MRWLTFAMVVTVLLVLQPAVGPAVSWFGVRPDWMLAVVVFFALFARPVEAVLSAWIIGAMGDLLTIERLGFLAVSYSLAAILVVSFREYLFRYRAATQFVVAFAVSLVVQSGWLIYCGFLYDSGDSVMMRIVRDWLFGSLYTAAWVPVICKGLLPFSGWLGLARPRYTFAGLHRIKAGSV